MVSTDLIPGAVYLNGVLQASGASIWAEDPLTDTAADTTKVTITTTSASRAAHGWLPALTVDPTTVGSLWLEAYIAASDTVGGPTVDVEIEIVWSSSVQGGITPFTDFACALTLPNDSGLTLQPVQLQLTDAIQSLTPSVEQVIARLTRTDSGHTGPRAIRFDTSGPAVSPPSGTTRTIVVAAARLRLDGKKTLAPPLQQYPRTDGLAASSTRVHWPDPNSIQRGIQRGPSATQ